MKIYSVLVEYTNFEDEDNNYSELIGVFSDEKKAIKVIKKQVKDEIGIEIHSGKNRIVRRIFEHLQYEVTKLDRVYYAGLTKKNLARGRFRHLTTQEVIMLKHFVK